MFAARNMVFTGEFSPLSLSPALWLSDTGSNPAQWDDLSGNNRHATQATPANQPAIVTGVINGRQVRSFDGSSDTLLLETGKDIARNIAGITIIAAYKWATNPISSKVVFSAQVSTGSNLRAWMGAGLTSRKLNIRARRFDFDVAAIANSSADEPEDFFIQCGVINYVTRDLSQYVNGALDGTATATFIAGNTPDVDSNNVAIGSNPGTGNFAAIALAEMIIYAAALSTAQRQQVERYLSAKYAIPLA
jgi:hypothetical protein